MCERSSEIRLSRQCPVIAPPLPGAMFAPQRQHVDDKQNQDGRENRRRKLR